MYGARADLSRQIAAVIVALGATAMAVLFGVFGALFPIEFTARVGILLLGGVVLLAALVAATARVGEADGRAVLTLLCAWAFLIGAVPAYLPFKFGALPGLNPIRVISLTLIATWVFQIIASRSMRNRLRHRLREAQALPYLLVLFLVWQIVTATTSEEPIFSFYYVAKGSVTPLLLWLIALSTIRGWEDLERVTSWLVWGALITSVFALVELVTKTNPFLPFFPKDPEQLQALGWILEDKSRWGTYRVSGTFSHPLALAEFVCLCFPLAITLAVVGRTAWRRWLARLSVPMFVVAVYVSHTRSALIGAAVVILVLSLAFSLRSVRQRDSFAKAAAGWLLAAFAVGSIFAASGVFGTLAQGRNPAERGSTQARAIMYERGSDAIARKPFLGYGPGLGAVTIGKLPNARTLTIDSHYLGVALEQGLTGLILFAGAATCGLWLLMRRLPARAALPFWFGAGCIAAVCASLTIKSVLSLTNNIDLLYVVLALGLVAYSLPVDERARGVGGDV